LPAHFIFMTRQGEFETVVLPHVAGLARVARRLTLDASMAEDLVQETLMLAWRSFHQFEAGSNLRAWLFRILMNAHYGRGRKLKREPKAHSLDERDAAQPGVPGYSNGERDLPVVLPRVLDSLGVRQGMDRLSEEHRAVLMLGVVEGLSCREMSDVLNVPIGTVMSRISRARLALREQLEVKTKARHADVIEIHTRRLREV
jgi:RNA polymerase sigma-70 factor, ECF subfamily